MTQTKDIERVGPHYTEAAMLETRQQSWDALNDIAAHMLPGMTEEQGIEAAKRILKARGMLRGWHQVCVRFGRNTVREYGNPSEAGVVLGADDIFFIDIGPLWNNCEGDVGATFVLGNNPEMLRAQTEVDQLWRKVRDYWHTAQPTGVALYQYATAQADAMGWELNLKRMSGHRIGDFSHDDAYDGLLSTVTITPQSMRWILETHIRHRTLPFGAFREDILMPA